jgi:hypothetical protein
VLRRSRVGLGGGGGLYISGRGGCRYIIVMSAVLLLIWRIIFYSQFCMKRPHVVRFKQQHEPESKCQGGSASRREDLCKDIYTVYSRKGIHPKRKPWVLNTSLHFTQ